MNWNKYYYVPFLKTQEAEFKAVQELSEDVKERILPFVILTKARSNSRAYLERNPDKIDGDIDKNIEKWKNVFGVSSPFFLDLSSEAVRQNAQIMNLMLPSDGYCNWVQFVREKKKDFPYIIPLIQINDAADTSDGENKRLQIEALLGDFDYIGYREEIFSSNDDANDFAGYIRETLEGVLLADGKAPTKLILILDVGYLFPNKHVQAADKVVKILNAISDLCIQHVIVTGTSFPLALSDFVEDQKAVEYEGTLNSETVPMYQCINSNYFGGVMPLYGDYALIHPVKNTAETYARGWIPRIDVSCGDIMHFMRRRRKNRDYKATYQDVAYRIISKKWFSGIPECWGKDKINDAAWGKVEQAIPRFWVAVRANIHISTIVAQINYSKFFED